MKRSILLAGIFLLAALCLLAQQQPPAPAPAADRFFYMSTEQRGGGGAAVGGIVSERKTMGYAVSASPAGVWMSTEFFSEGKPVKGAPYSGEAITESVQMLVDGNRISHSSSTKIYRDSEGRTRRELGTGAETLSPLLAAARVAGREQILISDPVAGVHYVLDPESKTGRKMPAPQALRVSLDKAPIEGAAGGGPISITTVTAGDKKLTEDVRGPEQDLQQYTRIGRPDQAAIERARAAGGGPVTVNESERQIVIQIRDLESALQQQTSTESLGTQTVEGIEAEGKRTTTTIPAGQIGNDLPIVITNETWYSLKLQTVVLSKRHDPRVGDTTYKLTNINLSEPAASLFQVPGDYNIIDVKAQAEEKMKVMRREK